MLEARNISKSYDGCVPVVKHISLTVEPGEFLCITGRSGSGKSTLLSLLSTLLEPDQGAVAWKGRRLSELPREALDRLRATEFSMVFQMHHLLPYLTVMENVCLPFMRGFGRVSAGNLARAKEWLGNVGLADKVDRLPGQLSGGEQQRVAIARAMVTEPSVVFADEPTGSLDRTNGEEVVRLLAALRGEGVSVVMVTHEAEYAALGTSQLHMEDGTLV